MKRVLLAGGAGFLGSHLADYLVDHGYHLDIVDNFDTGQKRNLRHVRNKIRLLERDVTNLTLRSEYDWVVNLASPATRIQWESRPADVLLTNLVGSVNLMRIALRCDALYLYASSSEVYGDPDLIPTPESYVGKVNTIGSRSAYDEGKRAGESLSKAFERQLGLRSIIVRLFNTYGPRMRGGNVHGRVIDRFIESARRNAPLTVYGDGHQTRSFIYVSDVINSLALLMEAGREGEVYNVGSSSEIEIGKLATLIRRLANSESKILHRPLPEDEPKRRAADTSKLAALGWSQTIELDSGLKKLLDQGGR